MTLTANDLERLDPFSRATAERLAQRFPDLGEGAWLETEEGDDEPFIVAQWPAPDDRGCDLELSTYGGEVTLSTRFWHEHSSLLEPAEGQDGIDAALDLLEQLMRGKVRPAIVFRDGEWFRSQSVHSDSELFQLRSELGPTDWLWVRSHDGSSSMESGAGPRPDDL